jgi:hypothetical protein
VIAMKQRGALLRDWPGWRVGRPPLAFTKAKCARDDPTERALLGRLHVQAVMPHTAKPMMVISMEVARIQSQNRASCAL